MIIATHKRDALLPPLIEHLTTTPPPSLRQIVFIWQNVGTPLPDFLNATALEHYSESGVEVKVRVSRKNSMNERFRPLADWHEHIRTRAVMIMDDDVALRRETLEWGYQQWKEFNDAGHGGPTKGKIVGFAGRDAEPVGAGKWGYTVQPRSTYSMVLSNAAWFKRDWLEKYWEDSQEMKGLRDYVDKGEYSALLLLRSSAELISLDAQSSTATTCSSTTSYRTSRTPRLSFSNPRLPSAPFPPRAFGTATTKRTTRSWAPKLRLPPHPLPLLKTPPRRTRLSTIQ